MAWVARVNLKGPESDTTPVSISSLYTASTGWTINSQGARKTVNTIFFTVDATYTGANVTVPTNGDISTQQVATTPVTVNRSLIDAGATTTGYGPNCNAMIQTNGNLSIVSMVPGATMNSGDRFSLVGSYPVS